MKSTSVKPDKGGPKRPEIIVAPGQLPLCVDMAEQVLLASGEQLYQRGTILVRPIRGAPMTMHSLQRADGALILIAVEAPWLTEQMARLARWVRLGKDENDLKTIDVPRDVAYTYLARVGRWNVPVLTGIIESPTLRPDGSILDQPGYDAQTGLLYQPSISFPPILVSPTRKDAEKALALLRDLIRDFPFADPHDESVALSAILTALVRRSLRAAPMHAFRAPKMASGKSLLADVTALVAIGRRVAVVTPTQDSNEERKRVFSLLLAGDPIASVDNVEQAWSSDTMCSVLTSETFQDRILGQSKTVVVPTSTFWLCTGNNLTFKGDLTTRVLPCDLDPKTERPEQRSFKRNLYEYIPLHRGDLVQAALTILRAHHLAGRPDMGLKPYGRFEDWSATVRAALVWLGMPDPCLSIADLEESDPIRQHLRTLLQSWHGMFGSKPATVAEAVQRATSELEDAAQMLNEACMEVAGERGSINQRILGRFLSKYERRMEGGLRIEKAGEYKHATLWRVSELTNSLQQPIDLKGKSAKPVSSESFPPADPKEDFLMSTDAEQLTHVTPQEKREPPPLLELDEVSFPPNAFHDADGAAECPF